MLGLAVVFIIASGFKPNRAFSFHQTSENFVIRQRGCSSSADWLLFVPFSLYKLALAQDDLITPQRKKNIILFFV